MTTSQERHAMLKRYSYLLLPFAFVCAFASVVVAQQPQNADKPAADLSLDSLMVEPPAAPEPIKIDPELLTPPKDASAEDLFTFIEELQDKLPEPKSQDDFLQIIDAYSQACLNVANEILKKDDLTDEQSERAVQLKVVALTTRMKTDPDAEALLNEFVEENLKNAKTDENLIKAYQLKLQVLAAKDDSLDSISALADELYSKEQEELKVFAIEVKAQVFITGIQKDGAPDMKVVQFVDDVIADKNATQRVKEKAYQMKLVASIILAQVEEDKEEGERDPKFEQEKEELFEKLLSDKNASLDLKKVVYQLRVQTLFDPSVNKVEDVDAKIEAVIEKLLKEEDPELYLLGVAVKGRVLITKAQEDQDAVKELAAFVDELNTIVKDKEEIKSQVVGLNIQLYRLQNDTDGLLAYVDSQLAATPDDDLKERLMHTKAGVVGSLVADDPKAFDKYAEFIDEIDKEEEFDDDVANIYISRFSASIAQLAKAGASLDDFNSAIEQYQKDLLAHPEVIRAILIVRDDVGVIGEKNASPTLYLDTIDKLASFCKGADNDTLNEIGQSLDGLKRQLEKETKDAEEDADASKAE